MPKPSVTGHLFADPSDDPVLVSEARSLGLPGEVAFLNAFAEAAWTLVPNLPMRMEDWCPKYAFIPASKTTRGGPARLTAVQRGLARLLQHLKTQVLINLKCPRLGISTFAALAAAYYLCWEQSDVLIYERSKPTAQVFSKDKLMPIFRASTSLKALLRPDGKTGEQDTWDNRELLTGANLKLRSIENEDSFKGIRGRLIICEECGDGGWQSGGANAKEGSKIDLALRRGQEYANGKVFLSGTPGVRDACLISAQWELSNQHLFKMPCPHCGMRQEFVPDIKPALEAGVRLGPGLRFTVNDRGIPDDCWYECGNKDCQAPAGRIDEVHKSRMMDLGDFELVREGEPGKVGTFIWMAYSEDPKATWLDCAKEYVKNYVNGDEEARKAFVTMFMATAYDPTPAAAVNVAALEARKETWHDADGVLADAPSWVHGVALGIDAQEGGDHGQPRQELHFVGFGEDDRLAVLDYVVVDHVVVEEPGGYREKVPAAPFKDVSNDLVREQAARTFRTADGRTIRVEAGCFDTSWNGEAAEIFGKDPRTRKARLIPIKGYSGEKAGERKGLFPLGYEIKQSNRTGRSYVAIGTQTAKDYLESIMGNAAGSPRSIVFADHLPRSYFEGLLAERKVKLKNGRTKWDRVSSSETGEELDTLVYAHAARRIALKRNHLLREKCKVRTASVDAAVSAEAEVQAAVAKPAAPEKPIQVAMIEAVEAAVAARDAAHTELPDTAPAPGPTQKPAGPRFRVVRDGAAPVVDEEAKRAARHADRLARMQRVKGRNGIGW